MCFYVFFLDLPDGDVFDDAEVGLVGPSVILTLPEAEHARVPQLGCGCERVLAVPQRRGVTLFLIDAQRNVDKTQSRIDDRVCFFVRSACSFAKRRVFNRAIFWAIATLAA
jgi:hypothetical protein